MRLVSQVSKTRCVEGNNWGWNRAGIWVDQGCEGVFRVQRRWAGGDGGHHGGRPGNGGGDWRPGPGWDQAIRVRCASNGFQYNMVVELRDRVDGLSGGVQASGSSIGTVDPVAEAGIALQALGYKPVEVSRLVREAAAPGDRAEEIIRKALKAALR